MKRPSFFGGVLVALVLSLAGGAAMAGGAWLLGGSLAFKVLIPMLAAGYVAHLLAASEEKVGRVVVTLAWLVASCLVWVWAPTTAVYVVTHVALIWLVRSLYFHSGLLAALADLGLIALGLGAAVWAIGQSGSVFLAIWCFFLVQALFVAIRTINPTRQRVLPNVNGFQRAHSVAEKAIRALAVQ